MLKYLLKFMLNLIIGFLSLIIPRNKNLILISSNLGQTFYGNPKYFFLYLTQIEHPFEFYWITKNKKILLMLQEKKLPTIYLYSRKGVISLIKSNYLIFSHGILDISFVNYLPGNFYKIQTWHGTPLKKIVKYAKEKDSNLLKKIIIKTVSKRDHHSYKIILSSTHEINEILSDSFDNNNVQVLGYPRNDIFYNKNLVFDDFIEEMKFKNYKKIILYCPTFRRYSSKLKPFSKEFLRNLNYFLTKNNYLFLIKSHINEKIEVNTQDLSNIVDVSDKIDDVQELLIDVDILISDYSSIFFDFVLLDKPIIFYCYDYERYQKEAVTGMYFDYFEELPGPFVDNEDDVLKQIQMIEDCFNDPEYKKKYLLFKNKFNLYQDGSSSQRLLEYILNIKNDS